MDYIREFDIRLDKEMFYAGEILEGHVVLDTIENFKLKSKLNENINIKSFILIKFNNNPTYSTYYNYSTTT